MEKENTEWISNANLRLEEECISKTQKDKGWSEEESREYFCDARRRLGISYKEYMKYQIYNIPKEKQLKFLLDERRNDQSFDECIKLTCERTGWSKEKAKSDIEETVGKYGISYKKYSSYKLYMVPKDKRRPYIINEYRKEVSKYECILEIANSTGWNYAQIMASMNKANKEIGVTYREYCRLRIYDIAEGKWAELKKNIVLETEEKKRLEKLRMQKANDEFVRKVADKANLTIDEARTVMDFAQKNTGVSYEQYYRYHFWSVTEEEQKNFFLKEMLIH